MPFPIAKFHTGPPIKQKFNFTIFTMTPLCSLNTYVLPLFMEPGG
jgi:hypothetical protein